MPIASPRRHVGCGASAYRAEAFSVFGEVPSSPSSLLSLLSVDSVAEIKVSIHRNADDAESRRFSATAFSSRSASLPSAARSALEPLGVPAATPEGTEARLF